MIRLIGFLFVAAGVVVGLLDWSAQGGGTRMPKLRDLGTLWFQIDRDSLQLAQPAIERHVSATLWQSVIQPALLLPAAPSLILFGLLVFFLGLSGRRRYR